MNYLFMLTYIPLMCFILGIFLITLSFFNLTSNRKITLKNRTSPYTRSKVKTKFIEKLEKVKSINKLIEYFQFTFGYFTSESEKNNKIKAENFTVNIIAFNFVVMISICVINILWFAKVIICLSIIIAEYMYINKNIKKKKQKLRDSFYILVREFIEGYAINKNVKFAFEYAVKELSPVYKVHVNRLIVQLSSKTAAEQAFKVFNKRVDYHMCSVFLSLVQSAYANNKKVNENLLMLQDMINDERKVEKESKHKLSSVTNNNIFWISCCFVVLVAVGYFCKTSTGNYFLTTEVGQPLLLATLAACILSVVCIKIADSF